MKRLELRDFLDEVADAALNTETKDREVTLTATEVLEIMEYIEELEGDIEDLEYELAMDDETDDL